LSKTRRRGYLDGALLKKWGGGDLVGVGFWKKSEMGMPMHEFMSKDGLGLNDIEFAEQGAL